ncbi:MAG: polysaccharide export protein [Candidatus Omnitrophica bacterium]|nr:polysaccharide export protein [Candidatus Omnitrophota bacterium]
MERNFKLLGSVLAILALTAALPAAQATPQEDLKVIESATEAPTNNKYFDPLKYTLGPDDVVQIDVMRHPEFSGLYPVNGEGKVQYKFVGDIDVNGLTKKEAEEKLKAIVSNFVISPEVNVTVMEYKSKIIYVLGEVGQPGKYYMRSETIPVREAVMQAGLPTQSAAMRKCRIITPDKKGKVKTRAVDLYSVLYGGNLQYDYEMRSGDVLYVPCTIMAKLIRVINPVSSVVGVSSSSPESISTGKSAITSLAK